MEDTMLIASSQQTELSEKEQMEIFGAITEQAAMLGFRSGGRCRSPFDADDAQHEAFVKILQRVRARWDRRRPLRPYIKRAARFELLKIRNVMLTTEIRQLAPNMEEACISSRCLQKF